jgi:hypothetical protein
MSGRIQKLANPLMLFFNIIPAAALLRIFMVGRRVGQGRKRIGARPIGRREQDSIELR